MSTFTAMLQDAKSDDSYWVEAAKLDFALEISRQMKAKSVSRADMAKLLGTSPAYITKLLRGDANLTIESMVKASRVLGSDLHMHIAHRDAAVRWLDVHTNQNPPARANPEASKWVKFSKELHHEPISLAA